NRSSRASCDFLCFCRRKARQADDHHRQGKPERRRPAEVSRKRGCVCGGCKGAWDSRPQVSVLRETKKKMVHPHPLRTGMNFQSKGYWFFFVGGTVNS